MFVGGVAGAAGSGGGGGGPTDPYWSYVKLLLTCDGTSGGTSFPDASPTGKTVTAYGNAITSSTAPKFGTASLYCGGDGGYLATPDSTDWNTDGDFTWELHFNLAVTSAQFIAGQRIDGSNYTMFQVTNGKLHFASGRSVGTIVDMASTTVLSTGVWYHGAVARSGDTYRLFLDGAMEASGVSATTPSDMTAAFVLGAQVFDTSKYLSGYEDNIRVTKGVARYTGAFAPPAAAFPTQ